MNPDGSYRLVLEADPGLALLARSLAPKAARLQPGRYAPHVTVVRHEIPPQTAAWGRHEGEEIEFEYDPFVFDDGTYFWVQVRCPRLEEVRIELGLPPMSTWTRPPDLADTFHLTVGNAKP